MIVSLLTFILPYSQPSHSSYHTLFVILMLLTINIIHELSTILHQPHFDIKLYYSCVFDSLYSRPSYDIHVSQLILSNQPAAIQSITVQTLYIQLVGHFSPTFRYDVSITMTSIFWVQNSRFLLYFSYQPFVVHVFFMLTLRELASS